MANFCAALVKSGSPMQYWWWIESRCKYIYCLHIHNTNTYMYIYIYMYTQSGCPRLAVLVVGRKLGFLPPHNPPIYHHKALGRERFG